MKQCSSSFMIISLRCHLSIKTVQGYPTFPGRLVLAPWSKLTDSPSVLSPNTFSVLNKRSCLTFAIVLRKRTVQKACFQQFLVSQPAINRPQGNVPAPDSQNSTLKDKTNSTLFLLALRQTPPPARRPL